MLTVQKGFLQSSELLKKTVCEGRSDINIIDIVLVSPKWNWHFLKYCVIKCLYNVTKQMSSLLEFIRGDAPE